MDIFDSLSCDLIFICHCGCEDFRRAGWLVKEIQLGGKLSVHALKLQPTWVATCSSQKVNKLSIVESTFQYHRVSIFSITQESCFCQLGLQV